MSSIAYIRPWGFATNSSSAHHVIRIRSEDLAGPALEPVPSPYELGYSSDKFVLSTRELKLDYLAAGAYQTYTHKFDLPHSEAVILVRHHFGDRYNEENLVGAGGDYNSTIEFPRPYLFRHEMSKFFLWLEREVVDRNDVVILGGDDYSGDYFYPEALDKDSCDEVEWFRLFLAHFRCPSDTVFVLDPSGYVVIFDRKYGRKIRSTLPDGSCPEKASVPELLDIKITGYCGNTCSYCYEDSGLEGKHADYWELLSILASHFRAWGVLEVAFGGGEPTAHPDFAELVRDFSEKGIVVNFSTGTLEWLEDPKIVQAVQNHVSGVAFTVSDPEQIEQWAACFRKNFSIWDFPHPRPYIHYILGVNPIKQLRKILIAAAEHSVGVVLLGPKAVGRGADYAWHDIKGWQNYILEDAATLLMIRGALAVDSMLAADLPGSEIDPRTYEKGDGKFSMFFDAVNMKIGPSSFSSDLTTLSGPLLNEALFEEIRDGWKELVC